jgi:hypothetical protein
LEVETRFALTQAASSGEPLPPAVYRDLLERRRMIIAGQLDDLVQQITVGRSASVTDNSE